MEDDNSECHQTTLNTKELPNANLTEPSSPMILKPCEHLVLPPSGIFKKSSVAVHGKKDGTVTHEKFDV